MTAALPQGFTVRVAGGVRVRDQGRVLVGGMPARILRLSAHARSLLDDGTLVVTGPTSRALAEHLLAADMAVPVRPKAPPVELGDVTVVVPVRDRTEEVRRLVAALAPHLRCVVVDDASADGSGLERVVRGLGGDYVRLDTNLGPAGARNAGSARVETGYVAFVDSDVSVAAGDLLRLCGHFADPRVAAVAPRVRGRPSTARPPRWFERYDAAASSLDLGDRSALVRPGGRVSYVPSACLVARTAALGCGFDESMRVGEDVDLVWRLHRQGRHVRYEADVVVHHRTPPTARAWLLRKTVYGTSAALLADRHGDAVAPAVFTTAGAATALALLLRTRWPALAATVAVGAGAVRLAWVLRGTPNAPRLAVWLSVDGVVSSARQLSVLLLRHWAPVTLPAALVSRRARPAVAAALVADVLVHSARTRTLRPGDVLARRLDDLAYGAGVWLGAARRRSAGCLRPRLVTRVSRTGPS